MSKLQKILILVFLCLNGALLAEDAQNVETTITPSPKKEEMFEHVTLSEVENEISQGVDLMSQRKYDEALIYLDQALDDLDRVSLPKNKNLEANIEQIRTRVTGLRAEAARKTTPFTFEKIINEIAKAFQNTQETSYDIWSGEPDRQKSR